MRKRTNTIKVKINTNTTYLILLFEGKINDDDSANNLIFVRSCCLVKLC